MHRVINTNQVFIQLAQCSFFNDISLIFQNTFLSPTLHYFLEEL
jgi:hypothetical protein